MKHLRSFVIVLITSAVLTACGGAGMNPATGSNALSAGSHSYRVNAGPSNSYKQIYVFKGTPDGASPFSGFVAVNGRLYGTTLNGSKNYCSGSCGSNNCYKGCGTIFEVDPAGTENVVYNFKGNFNGATDGSWPFDTLTLVNAKLYGTTSSAGQYAHGTVFTSDIVGNEHVIYQFMGGADGAGPEAPVIGLHGKLYGTTVVGGGAGCGGAGCGTVFSLTTTGTEHVLYAFRGGTDGERIYAGVTALHGVLYGATLQGGGSGCGGGGCGTLYKLTLTGQEHVLHTFSGTDGDFPNGLTVVNGVLYGTTEGGGTKNSGTFFSITPSGTFKTLYNFTDIPDGNLPGANLIYSKGTFYGTTVGGGTAGNGTVFSITKSGTETVLYSFKGGTDGQDLQGPVHLLNGWLYGTTTSGGGTGCGGSGCGTIFKVQE
jgi:uncharacterized repeat protein (TIGR03803 family)